MAARPAMRPATTSESLKAVETLFETQTVIEIREVETKTRTDIEEKQKQLRLLVGNSYRDLISSADTILEMGKTCDNVLLNIAKLRSGLSQLASSSGTANELTSSRQEASKRQTLHAIGSRIKYLVDTPEMIWGCLDTHAYLDAARRFLRAGEVYRQLQEHSVAELRTKFPIVKRQWPNILKFRQQIQDRVEQRLQQHDLYSVEDCSIALAAAASLQDDMTSQKALEMFLNSRLRVIRELFQQHLVATPPPAARAASAISQAVKILQEAVWQVGRLFLGHSPSSTHAQLPEVLQEEGVSGELLFELLQDQAKSDRAPEADAWQALSAAIKARLAPLTQQATAQAVSEFLKDAAVVLSNLGQQCVRACCRSASELSALEAELQSAVKGWRHTEAAAVGDALLSPRHSMPVSTPKSQAAGTLEPLEGVPETWDTTCEWVLGKRTSLWDLVLETTFIQVSKQLIKQALEALEEATYASTTACLQQAQTAAAAPPGAYRALSWPEATPEEIWPKRKRQRYETPAGSLQPAEQGEPSWRQKLAAVQSEFNKGLQAVLSDTLLLLTEQGSSKEPQLRRGFSGRTFPLPPSSQSRGRAAALQPFLQESCLNTASNIQHRLASLLEDLPEAAAGPQGATTVEQAVLLGRLCLAISTGTLLPVILGSPEAWKEATRQTDFGQTEIKPRGTTQGKFVELQQSFRATAAKANQIWAQWAAEALGDELRQSITADAALTSPVALRVWEETVISQEGEEEGKHEETRFHLPALPSPGIMMFLLAAGRELQRSGGTLPGSTALSALKLELANAAQAALSHALESGSPLEQSLSEKGVLQLLFDLRFLRDVLSGGQAPPLEESKRQEAEAREVQAGFSNLEQNLQGRLDPIDWAIYGMFLWQNEAAFFHRVRVLFGSLLLLSSSHPKKVTKPVSSSEANILQFAPTAGRFGYLPISTPSATAAGLQQLPATGTSRDGEDQQSNDYSFANLGSMKTGSNLEREAESAASSAFEALQSRFTSQRLGALGTLLGDRAAEVTAMAQQSFSDMSLPTAFTSALGGSGTSTTGGLLASFRGFRAVSK